MLLVVRLVHLRFHLPKSTDRRHRRKPLGPRLLILLTRHCKLLQQDKGKSGDTRTAMYYCFLLQTSEDRMLTCRCSPIVVPVSMRSPANCSVFVDNAPKPPYWEVPLSKSHLKNETIALQSRTDWFKNKRKCKVKLSTEPLIEKRHIIAAMASPLVPDQLGSSRVLITNRASCHLHHQPSPTVSAHQDRLEQASSPWPPPVGQVRANGPLRV